MKLRQLNRRVTAHYDAVVGASGLKNTQYTLLSHVVQLGPIRPSDLAARMVLDASTLTRNLQPLVALGLLVIEPGADGRSRLVRVTEAGLAKRIEMQRLWKQAQLALNGRLGEARATRLHEMLDECLALLEEPESSEDGQP